MVMTRLNSVLHYDRACVYRVAPEDCKCVAEERHLGSLFLFMGLKFPPLSQEEQVKYTMVGVRVLFDTSSFPSTLIGSFDATQKPTSLRSPRGTLTTVFASGVGRGNHCTRCPEHGSQQHSSGAR